ncbi:MAG: hypothetical protein V4850_05855 [Myxococcota bacterium]
MIDGFAHEPSGRRRLLQLLTWTWCLPTTLVALVAGWFTVLVLGGRAAPYRGATVVRSPRFRNLGGVCLGPVILVADSAGPELVAHEWGHFRQHLRLGPLYLLVIGIPSVTHALWHQLRGGTFPDYFHFWTEAWADHLGGVYDRHAHRHARWTGYAFGPLVTVLVGVITLRAFGHALAFPFTDADALVDVAWARFPLRDQLLVPLTGGLGGDNANFWRPAAMVQFWALRHVFGEAPPGWHAWSLFLHVVTAVMAGLLLEALLGALRRGVPTSRDRWIAGLGAVLFAAHPLAEEVVPATARNLDLLLGVGFFGALLALVRGVVSRREGRRDTVARVLFFVFGALALTSKEAGILLLPIGAAWIVLLDAPRTRLAHLRTLTRFLGPLAVAAVAFLVVRAHVLDGLGGYRESGAFGDVGLLAYAMQRGFLEPLVSSLSGLLAPLEGVPGGVLAFVVWAVLLWCLRRNARLLALLAVFYVPWILLLGFTGTYSRRVVYVPTFAIAAVLGLAVVEVVSWVSWGGARARRGPLDPRAHVASSALLSVVTIALLGAWLHGSPALRRYADWGAVGRVTTPLLDPALWAPVPDGATVWLVDRPVRVDVDPRRYRLWSKRKSLNNSATTYAIEAWVDEHVPRGLTLRTLTSILPEGLPEAFPATVAAAPDRIEVTRPPVGRSVMPAGGLRVDESPNGVVITTTAAEPAWVMVWDPQAPVLTALQGAGE